MPCHHVEARVFVKLCKLSFKLIHLTTHLLPVWKESLVELDLPIQIMPHDVSTCWNSTYDMVRFTIEY